MKVLFLPYSKWNPYHQLLDAALKKTGVVVYKLDDFKHKSFIEVARLFLEIRIIHLIWTNQFFITESRLISYVRAAFFMAGILVIKALGKKIVWTIHNKYNHEEIHKDLDIAVNTWLARHVDAMKVECLEAQKIIAKQYNISPKKITTIPEGNYISIYENTLSQKEARKRLGLSSKHKTLLFMGAIRPYKGIFELLDIFKMYDDLNLRIIVAGKPINKIAENSLIKAAKGDSRIILRLDYIPNPDVQIYMNSSDIVVLPFNDILTSGSLLMAMGFAKAVIAPDMGCVNKSLKEKGGFLYERGKLNTQFKSFLLTPKSKLKKMGYFNKKQAIKLSWESIAPKVKSMYKTILSV